MRTLIELTDTEDPAWPLVQQWLAQAPEVEILEVDPPRAAQTLLDLQVSLRSTMGAVAYHSGGLLVGHGWLRVLGSGGERMQRGITGWNDGKAPIDGSGRPQLLLVADDVLGGLFAVNGGAFGEPLGHVFYLAPDTLQWEGLSMGYSDFVAWALSPRLDDFYRELRWPGWEAEVSALRGDEALAIYPFLWAAGESLEARSRRRVLAEELFRLTMDMQAQLAAQKS